MSTKRILLFWGLGLLISVALAALASVMPSVFGPFTLPFWALPAVAGFGAHDSAIIPLGLLGASLFYGALSFLVFRIFSRRIHNPKS